jgi:hypothetical protein
MVFDFSNPLHFCRFCSVGNHLYSPCWSLDVRHGGWNGDLHSRQRAGPLELILSAEHISFVPEAHIQSGHIDVKLDYTSSEEKDKSEHYGPLKEISEVGKRFVRRIVDSHAVHATLPH